MLTFLHAADFHLDSAFGALTARQAASRRRESRELGFRLANYVNQNGVDLVLLAGDLLAVHVSSIALMVAAGVVSFAVFAVANRKGGEGA